jgi:hypothetical protein
MGAGMRKPLAFEVERDAHLRTLSLAVKVRGGHETAPLLDGDRALGQIVGVG